MRESLELLCKSFVEALYAPFFQEYGIWYDRIKLLIEGDPESIAIILEKRRDLNEEKLHTCVYNAKKCLEILLSEDVCKADPHASTFEDYQDEIALFIAGLFDNVDRMGGWQFYANEEAIKRHLDGIFPSRYLEYETYLYDEKPFNYFISPIQNFISENNIKLDEGAEIRSVTEEELLNLVRPMEWKGDSFYFYPGFVLCVPDYCEISIDYIYNIITALRLTKKERVGLSRVEYVYALPTRPWKNVKVPEELTFKDDNSCKIYNLTREDEHDFKDLVIRLNKIISEVEEDHYLLTAIHRFNLGYERRRTTDRWIDYCISLESLYSKENTEITNRLSTRAAKVLEEAILDKRITKKKQIMKWYGIRSNLVHGTSNIESELKDLPILEDDLRKSIRWFISHKYWINKAKIIDILDLCPQ